MSRVLITGSTEGLGLMAATLLAGDGHSVTLQHGTQTVLDKIRQQPDAAPHQPTLSIQIFHRKSGLAHSCLPSVW